VTNAEKDEDRLPPAEAERRFNRLVGKLVNTPHKPHVKKAETSTAERTRGNGRGQR